MERKNCWEVQMCGREPGGENVAEHGVCPAALPSEYDGINKGRYAGRFCWAVAGTFCGDSVQDAYVKKLKECLACEFLKRVTQEEGRDFILSPQNVKVRR
ncbi:MAG: hypothetical protein JW936_03320 [Sedimentisphaerales bacterium]|nr:hypothetical protein [Sedimentisphaerales bacterium]